MSVDDQIDELQRELNAKEAEIARLRAIQPCCGSRFLQVGPVSKSEPAFMPVHLPFPSMDVTVANEVVTIATLDKDGNLVVKVDQPANSEASKPDRSKVDGMLRAIGAGRKIEAVKIYRDVFNALLRDAKDAVELAMPLKPVRNAPEVIADRILMLVPTGDAEIDEKMGEAIAYAIRAERS